jgi:hypothetical protein
MEFTLELKDSDFVSGERIQEIADITYFGTNNCNIPKQLENTKTIIRDRSDFYVKDNERIVYVYGHDLDLFFREAFQEIKHPIKLISHNTDFPVDSKYIQYLDDDKLLHWYAQNAILEHLKLTPVPIGIANKQWPHGNVDNFLHVIRQRNQKENLVYKNFDIGTNTGIRNRVNHITNQNGFFMDSHHSHTDYLQRVAKSLFIISPQGNGIDCHRIWESLYLGTVPIVEKSSAFRNFTNLPILFIDKWEDVTPDFVKAQIPNFYNHKFDLTKITMPYWKALINE